MAYRKPLATPVGLATFFSLFAILAVGARFWARRKNRMKLQMDDWFLIPALVCFLILVDAYTYAWQLLCLANSIIMLIGMKYPHCWFRGPNSWPPSCNEWEPGQTDAVATRRISCRQPGL